LFHYVLIFAARYVRRTNRRAIIAMMFVCLSVRLSVRPSVLDGRALWSYGAI